MTHCAIILRYTLLSLNSVPEIEQTNHNQHPVWFLKVLLSSQFFLINMRSILFRHIIMHKYYIKWFIYLKRKNISFGSVCAAHWLWKNPTWSYFIFSLFVWLYDCWARELNSSNLTWSMMYYMYKKYKLEYIFCNASTTSTLCQNSECANSHHHRKIRFAWRIYFCLVSDGFFW